MTREAWKKYGRHVNESTHCHICGRYITKGDESVTYIKTNKGSHLFVHNACAGLKGGSHD